MAAYLLLGNATASQGRFAGLIERLMRLALFHFSFVRPLDFFEHILEVQKSYLGAVVMKRESSTWIPVHVLRLQAISIVRRRMRIGDTTGKG